MIRLILFWLEITLVQKESKAYFLVGQNAEGGLQNLVDRLLGRE